MFMRFCYPEKRSEDVIRRGFPIRRVLIQRVRASVGSACRTPELPADGGAEHVPQKQTTATTGGMLWCSKPHSTTLIDGFKPIELEPACRVAGLSPSEAGATPVPAVKASLRGGGRRVVTTSSSSSRTSWRPSWQPSCPTSWRLSSQPVPSTLPFTSLLVEASSPHR